MEQIVQCAASLSTSCSERTRPAVDFASMLAGIPSVVAVLAHCRDWGYDITTVVQASSTRDRYAIYDCQWRLMEQFADVEFEFHVLDCLDRSLEECISIPDDAYVILL